MRFLEHKDKVKVTIMFRGRELVHPERGEQLLMRLAEELKELGDHRVDAQPRRPQHDHDAGAREVRKERVRMPKMKTHSATKKRFRLTAGGKVVRRKAFKSHILEKKSAKRKRGFRKNDLVSQSDRREVLTLLGKR